MIEVYYKFTPTSNRHYVLKALVFVKRLIPERSDPIEHRLHFRFASRFRTRHEREMAAFENMPVVDVLMTHVPPIVLDSHIKYESAARKVQTNI